ncbi:MAG: TonB-dependent receptor plug domain-containing protein, partial [Bacteroidota bacterium]
MKNICYLLPFLLLIFQFSFSQSHQVSGYLEQSKTGEGLIHALVRDTLSDRGTLSNEYGFFSLELESGPISLEVSYEGFRSVFLHFILTSDTLLKLDLSPYRSLEVVEINEKSRTRPSSLSRIKVDLDLLQKLPQIGGESDLIKVLQLSPGFQAGTEGSAGLYTRGGSPDQNLYLLDGIPIYNPNHLFGFLSSFNPDMINTAEALKGGFPARYGGRLSSVIDVRLKEGNMNEFERDVKIGALASRLTLQGPIQKDKSSFIV